MNRETCFDGGSAWCVEDLLARGEWTEVHAVRHPSGWSAVRKTLHAREHADAFAREVACTEQAVRAGAPVVLGKGRTDDGAPFVVLERLDGGSVSAHIEARGGRFDMLTTFVLVDRLLRAVQLLHDVGIVHCDLSAENVFVTSAGAVRILDYGAAVRRADGDPRVDVFAAGTLMWELLGGGGAPGALDHLPRPVLRLVECATSPNPSSRFGTAVAMRRAIELLHREHGGAGFVTAAPVRPTAIRGIRSRWASASTGRRY